ncbi:MAG: hypothetical protein CMJ46_02550 [Planctomyces sp.]|nr:hypothetical protein [Planctomyces sp.]
MQRRLPRRRDARAITVEVMNMIDLRNMTSRENSPRARIIVVGDGRVGLRFCQKMVELDLHHEYELIVFSEERLPAYDRHALAAYGQHRNDEQLLLAPTSWYAEHGITLHLSDRILKIDRGERQILSSRGEALTYDRLVLATGSYSYVPSIVGNEQQGIHLFRSIKDMERIIADREHCRSVAVIGGGLFGLEAAKAVFDLGLKTHIIESAPWLMQHQLDETGAACLREFIEAQGVEVHLNKTTTDIRGNGTRVTGLGFQDETGVDVDMVVFAAGIRPRDELGRICQLDIHSDGGIVVNNQLQTSDPHIYAIGKAAWHPDLMCGLVSPGCQMADVLAANLTGTPTDFTGIEQAVNRNIMGVNIACFGDEIFSGSDFESVTWRDPGRGIYRKLYINPQGTRILGGILVGDTSDYDRLLSLMKTEQTLTCSVEELLKNEASTSETSTTLAPPSPKLTRKVV